MKGRRFMKVNLIVEPEKGEPFEQEIEVAEGDHLIFKIHEPARSDELAEVAKRIQRFFDGGSRFILLPESISIVKVRAIPTAGGA